MSTATTYQPRHAGADFEFHIPFSGDVNAETGIIRNVSLMTGALVAEGHDLVVDDKTLRQVVECAKKMGQIPVKFDHGGGVVSLCGHIDGRTAHVEGSKVRADWHLLKSHSHYRTTIELAQTMPGCFGLSAAFKAPDSGCELLTKGAHKGKKAARCERLLAVDCVTQPAANPDGLFSAKTARIAPPAQAAVDTPRVVMPENQNTATAAQPGAEPTLADVLKAVTDLGERITTIEGLQQQQQQQPEPDLAQLANMTDEEIDAAGFNVALVHAAVQSAIDSGELTEGEPGGDAAAQAAADAATAAATGSPTGVPAGAAEFQGAVAKIVRFEVAKIRKVAADAATAEATEHALGVIEAKTIALAEENDALTELSARQGAEIKALKLTLQTSGVRSAGASGEVTLFDAGGAPAGSYEQLVTAKYTELKAKAGVTETSAKAQAIQFCVKNHSGAFADYRARGGKIQL